MYTSRILSLSIYIHRSFMIFQSPGASDVDQGEAT